MRTLAQTLFPTKKEETIQQLPVQCVCITAKPRKAVINSCLQHGGGHVSSTGIAQSPDVCVMLPLQVPPNPFNEAAVEATIIGLDNQLTGNAYHRTNNA